MKDCSSNSSIRKRIAAFFYENKIGLSIIILIILTLILMIPPLGILFAFVIVAFLVLFTLLKYFLILSLKKLQIHQLILVHLKECAEILLLI